MDFLRLTRSRSRSISKSSTGTKRTPQTSPDRLDGATHGAAGPQTLSASPAAAATSTDQQQPQPLVLDNGKTVSSCATPLLTPTSASLSKSGGLQVVEFSFPSLLSPPNPAFVAGGEARGILLNCQRPTISLSRQTSQDIPAASNTATTSSDAAADAVLLTLANTTTQGPLSGLAQSRPHLRASASADSVSQVGGLLAPPSKDGTVPLAIPNAQTLTSSTEGTPAGSQPATPSYPSYGRIRFAPLPEPRRPRSHSTGRDIWFDEDSENHVHVNTRDGTKPDPSSWSSSIGSSGSIGDVSSLQSGSLAMSLGEGSSYKTSEDGMSGSVPSTSSLNVKTQSHRRSSSTLAKFLQPLKLGRSKSRELDGGKSSASSVDGDLQDSLSPNTHGNTFANWLTGGEPLSRSVSSGAGPNELEKQRKEEFRNSGVPLKKSSTMESQKGNYGSASSRRMAYPSVAQGGNRVRASLTAVQSSSGAGPAKIEEPEFVEWSNVTGRKSQGDGQDEDDGSGMAWLKKRRLERERKAKEEAEAADKKAGEDSTASEGDAGLTQDGSAALSIVDDQAKNALHANATKGSDAAKRSDLGLLSLGAQGNAGTAMPNTSLVSPTDSDTSSNSIDGVSGEDEENSGDFADANDEPDQDDDLSAAEIEEEERLAEEARRTTDGASREVFHSHEHRASTFTFEGSRRVSAASSLSMPPFDRKSSLPASTNSGHLPRAVAASHPGDWPMKDSLATTC